MSPPKYFVSLPSMKKRNNLNWEPIYSRIPRSNMKAKKEDYKHLDLDVIKKTLEDIFSDKQHKFPIGTKHHGDNIYSISSGSSIIYTTKAGVEEFNRVIKEEFEKNKPKENGE